MPARYSIASSPGFAPAPKAKFVFPALRKSWMPCCDGIRPVRIEARAGEQTGEVQKKRVKRNPLAASRSRFGVRISSLPAHPMAQ